jgi:hypothetical protein
MTSIILDCILYLEFQIPSELVSIIHQHLHEEIDDLNIRDAVDLYYKKKMLFLNMILFLIGI